MFVSGRNWIIPAPCAGGCAYNTLLLYATGGLAWGHVDTTFETFGVVLANPANSSPAQRAALTSVYSASSAKVQIGYAVGGGVEWAFAPIGRSGANTCSWISVGRHAHHPGRRGEFQFFRSDRPRRAEPPVRQLVSRPACPAPDA
jgi:hypothetical protein